MGWKMGRFGNILEHWKSFNNPKLQLHGDFRCSSGENFGGRRSFLLGFFLRGSWKGCFFLLGDMTKFLSAHIGTRILKHRNSHRRSAHKNLAELHWRGQHMKSRTSLSCRVQPLFFSKIKIMFDTKPYFWSWWSTNTNLPNNPLDLLHMFGKTTSPKWWFDGGLPR